MLLLSNAKNILKLTWLPCTLLYKSFNVTTALEFPA